MLQSADAAADSELHPAMPWLAVADDEAHLWVTELDRWTALAEQRRGWLSAEELAEAAGLLLPRHRSRQLARRVFLRSILGGYLGVPPQRVELARRALGKPVLADPTLPLGFSVAHSNGLAVCAVAAGEVGVDVEYRRRLSDPDGMAGRILSAREQTVYHAQEPAGREVALLRFWTQKEAFLKATGEGITRPMKDVEIVLAGDATTPTPLAATREPGAPRWSAYEMRPAPDSVCTMIADRPLARLLVFRWPDRDCHCMADL